MYKSVLQIISTWLYFGTTHVISHVMVLHTCCKPDMTQPLHRYLDAAQACANRGMCKERENTTRDERQAYDLTDLTRRHSCWVKSFLEQEYGCVRWLQGACAAPSAEAIEGKG